MTTPLASSPGAAPTASSAARSSSTAATGRWYESLSRVLDLVVAVTALVLAAPLMVVIAIVIRLTSPGPALFRQQRVGRGGRAFTVYKFRTMRHDASDERHRELVSSLISDTGDTNTDGADEPVFKLRDDDRITAVGRWLRRFSLDELPQFFNVIEGTMSIVGPRPGLPYEVELYGDLERRRLLVKPGITGLWQVSGRNHLSMREMYELDSRYVAEQSLALDVRILARTPAELIRPSGAS